MFVCFRSLLHFVLRGFSIISLCVELVPCLLECEPPGVVGQAILLGPASQCSAQALHDRGLRECLHRRLQALSGAGLSSQSRDRVHPVPPPDLQQPAQWPAWARVQCPAGGRGGHPDILVTCPVSPSAGCLPPARSSATGRSPWTAQAQRPTSPAASWALKCRWTPLRTSPVRMGCQLW